MVAEGLVAASGSLSNPQCSNSSSLSRTFPLFARSLARCEALVSFSRCRGTTAWRQLTMCILITTLSPGLVSRVRERQRRAAKGRPSLVGILAAGKWRNGWVTAAAVAGGAAGYSMNRRGPRFDERYRNWSAGASINSKLWKLLTWSMHERTKLCYSRFLTRGTVHKEVEEGRNCRLLARCKFQLHWLGAPSKNVNVIRLMVAEAGVLPRRTRWLASIEIRDNYFQ